MRWWFVLLLLGFVSCSIEAAERGKADSVRDGARRMVGLAQEMVEQGTKGHVDLLGETALRAIAEGTRALAAVSPTRHQHERDAVEELEEAISEAQQAIASAEQGQQDQAVAHSKKVLTHARRGLSHAEAL